MPIDVRRRQRGVSIVFVIVVVVAVAVVFLTLMALFRNSSGMQGSSRTDANLGAAANALEQYASTAARLPCPADPSLDTGDAVPTTATATCNFAAGTIPWRTIGLAREGSLDSWGEKISYRVYSGVTGLTQTDGASMVKCDTVEPTPAGTTANGLCKDTNDTADFQFSVGKGFTVSDYGNNVPRVAYVLISHGPTGQGGYTSSGSQKLPAPTNPAEIANISAAGPFVAQAAVTTGLTPTDGAFFDDVIAYRTIDEFVRRANLSARDWPEPSTATSSILLNAATVAAAVGHSVAFGDNLNQASIDFGTATVTGYRSGARTSDLAFDDGATGTTGEGVGGLGITRGNTLISSSRSEFLRVDFDTRAAKLGITLNNFGIYRSGGRDYTEQVQFTFYDAGVQVGSPAVRGGCAADGGLASYSLDAPALYDRVDVTPIASTASGGRTSTTSFLVSSFAACSAGAGACHSPLETINPASVCP